VRCDYCGHDNMPGYGYCGGCGQAAGVATRPSLPRLAGTDGLEESLHPAAAGARAVQSRSGAHRRTAWYDVTRYLCAAVHLDSKLASEVVEKVLEEDHRGVASSPGVDLVRVLSHALAARSRQVTRDVLLTLTLVTTVVLIVAVHPLLLYLGFFVAWFIVTVEAFVARYGAAAQRLKRGSTSSDPPSTKFDSALARIKAYEHGNVTVYSQYTPFIGYGTLVGTWSFALDVCRAADEDEPVQEFRSQQLLDRLAQEIRRLDLPNISVGTRVLVGGLDVMDDGRFLSDPLGSPVPDVAGDLVQRLLEDPEDYARPYLTVPIIGWDGQLTCTVFLRLVRSASNLFVEANYTLLPPLRKEYFAIDHVLPQPTFPQLLSLITGSTLQTFRLLASCVPSVFKYLLGPSLHQGKLKQQRKEIQELRYFNYGALLSIREAAMDTHFQRFFQKLDQDMYLKVVEKRILDTLVAFLEEHNVDTRELKDREYSIINNGIMMSGNASIRADAVAAGKNARAGTKVLRRPSSQNSES